MPDAIPPFDPRPGDYDAMLGRATHRRRVRRVRALAAVAPVVTLAVALAALPGGNAASLRPANEGATVAGESPEPGGTEQPTPPADPTPTGDPSSDPTADPTGDPGGDPGAEPEPSEDPDTSPASPKPTHGAPPPTGGPDHSPAPSASPTGQGREQVAKYAYLTGEAPAGCRTEGGAQQAPDTANWCASYAGETTLDAGSVVSLPFRLCRSGVAIPGRLTRYDPSSWMKARVVGDDGWVWHDWRRAEQPAVPVIDVAAGDCVQWTVEWRVTVEPGEYRLNPVFIVDEYRVGGDANHFAVTVRG